MSEQIIPAFDVEEHRRNAMRSHFKALVWEGVKNKETWIKLPCYADWFIKELEEAGYEVFRDKVKLPGEPVIELKHPTTLELFIIGLLIILLLSAIR